MTKSSVKIPYRTLMLIAWPLAMLSTLRALYLGLQGNITNDYKPVFQALNNFRNHRPVYIEDLNSVTPHYLYPPSASLLLSPLTLFSYNRSRELLILLSICAILAGTALLLHFAGLSYFHPLVPGVIFILMTTESVIHSLSFTNINGILFFIEAFFLSKYLTSKTIYEVFAALLLGITLAIKPIFAPLLVLLLLYKKWVNFLLTVAVPIFLNICAWGFSVDPDKFFTRIIPYLKNSRSFYNSAISGMFKYYGISPWLTLVLQIILGCMVIVTLLILLKTQKNDSLIFSCSFTTISLAAIFLLSSLGQGYYSLFLIPVLITVFYPQGLARNPWIWIGFYLCLNNGPWLSSIWPNFGRNIDFWRITAGWTLIILSAYASEFFRYNIRRTAREKDMIIYEQKV